MVTKRKTLWKLGKKARVILVKNEKKNKRRREKVVVRERKTEVTGKIILSLCMLMREK